MTRRLPSNTQYRNRSHLPQLSIVRLILDAINLRREPAATELGADPATRLELRCLFHQAALVIEDERITAGQDRLGRERLQTSVQLLPVAAATQQYGLTRPAQSGRQPVEFVASSNQLPQECGMQRRSLSLELAAH